MAILYATPDPYVPPEPEPVETKPAPAPEPEAPRYEIGRPERHPGKRSRAEPVA
jgi:hypothetical protein